MLYNEITYLFGLPIFKVKINPELYEKKKILSQIEKNYKTSKVRNKWSLDSYILTDIHHSIQDENNPAFKKINYYSLSKQYDPIITDFFHKLSLQRDFQSTYKIVNYTCVRHNSFMMPHIHTDCTFSLIHYISFDNKQHLPTIFKNPYYFNYLLPHRKNLQNILANKEENSWIYQEWTVPVEEDDVMIVPAILEHYVRNLDSKKSRVTIVANIETTKNENN